LSWPAGRIGAGRRARSIGQNHLVKKRPGADAIGQFVLARGRVAATELRVTRKRADQALAGLEEKRNILRGAHGIARHLPDGLLRGSIDRRRRDSGHEHCDHDEHAGDKRKQQAPIEAAREGRSGPYDLHGTQSGQTSVKDLA